MHESVKVVWLALRHFLFDSKHFILVSHMVLSRIILANDKVHHLKQDFLGVVDHFGDSHRLSDKVIWIVLKHLCFFMRNKQDFQWQQMDYVMNMRFYMSIENRLYFTATVNKL